MTCTGDTLAIDALPVRATARQSAERLRATRMTERKSMAPGVYQICARIDRHPDRFLVLQSFGPHFFLGGFLVADSPV